MTLNDTDKKLLNRVQGAFPLESQPYAAIGQGLGISGDEVIDRLARLKEAGIIRQIGPVLDARRLGYRSTLVAMRLAAERLEPATRYLVEHPGVSHAYQRDHHFNLWFTLAIPPGADPEAELARLAAPMAAETVVSLPARKMFKLQAYFDVAGDGGAARPGPAQRPPHNGLTQTDRAVINEVQQDLALVPAPFVAMAGRLAITEADLLARCRSLLERGIIRRFGAAVNHRRAGFPANAMTCWIAPPERVDAAGRALAGLREVSHCYDRQTSPQWPYNLFAMIHSQSQEACREIADEVSGRTGLGEYVMLFSTRELKKTRVRYTV
ncbi:MAG: Lrp/AsnC family transcriptional regulator [Chloroflexota bacterium]